MANFAFQRSARTAVSFEKVHSLYWLLPGTAFLGTCCRLSLKEEHNMGKTYLL